MSDLPPRFLRAEQAAAYLGVSVDTFRAEVAAGMWPPPIRRGARTLTWDRLALDKAADTLMLSGKTEAGSPLDPMKAAEAKAMAAAMRD